MNNGQNGQTGTVLTNQHLKIPYLCKEQSERIFHFDHLLKEPTNRTTLSRKCFVIILFLQNRQSEENKESK